MENIYAILPSPTRESTPFWEGCNRDALLLQQCQACKHVFYYARSFCPQCGDDKLIWQAASGQGIVYSFSHVHVSFYGPRWESQIPYTSALIDLAEGVRMLSRITGPERERVKIGDSVSVSFVAYEGQKLPFFALAPKD